jgi:hypothetical protein
VEPEIWAALIGGVAGLLTGGLGVYAAQAQARRESRAAREDVLARYRDPLVSATFDLQDRVQNLLRPDDDSICVYLEDRARKELTIRSTLFRIAQYFGWMEIMRREIEFLPFEESSETQAVQEAMGAVARTFATDKYGTEFMLWREEQRAIGEHMAKGDVGALKCIGFAAFDSRYDDDFERWFKNTRVTLETGDFGKIRLAKLHHALIDLGKVLDPGERRWRWPEWDPRDERYDGPAIDPQLAAEVTARALVSREARSARPPRSA